MSSDIVNSQFYNKPAPDVSYFTPAQEPPAGTLVAVPDGKETPKLFKPLKLRNLTLPNRVMLAPMCQYSAEDGHYTMWHTTHMGGIIQRGPGIATVEATSVTANGRITPEDVGLWKDSQIEPLAKVVEFAHSQNQKIMIQLGHAGRKASTAAPWLSAGHAVGPELGGWPDNVWGPSAIPFSDVYPPAKEMTKADIEEFKDAFGASVRRAVKAGFDVIQIHNAHGYLLHEFVSAVTNQRTDAYGGSWENRVRLTLETVDIARQNMPKDMPLALRISATDWLEEHKDKDIAEKSWKVADTVKLATILAERGVDLIDVSSGGNHPDQHIHSKPGYQAPFALEVKKAVGDKMLVSTVGMIDSAELAEDILNQGLDMVAVARGFLKNPGLIFKWADDLGVSVQMPAQIGWGFAGRGSRGRPKKQ